MAAPRRGCPMHRSPRARSSPSAWHCGQVRPPAWRQSDPPHRLRTPRSPACARRHRPSAPSLHSGFRRPTARAWRQAGPMDPPPRKPRATRARAPGRLRSPRRWRRAANRGRPWPPKTECRARPQGARRLRAAAGERPGLSLQPGRNLQAQRTANSRAFARQAHSPAKSAMA